MNLLSDIDGLNFFIFFFPSNVSWHFHSSQFHFPQIIKQSFFGLMGWLSGYLFLYNLPRVYLLCVVGTLSVICWINYVPLSFCIEYLSVLQFPIFILLHF